MITGDLRLPGPGSRSAGGGEACCIASGRSAALSSECAPAMLELSPVEESAWLLDWSGTSVAEAVWGTPFKGGSRRASRSDGGLVALLCQGRSDGVTVRGSKIGSIGA